MSILAGIGNSRPRTYKSVAAMLDVGMQAEVFMVHSFGRESSLEPYDRCSQGFRFLVGGEVAARQTHNLEA